MAEHSHIDFSVLDFLPEIRELSYYAKLKKEQRKVDPRYQRTHALLQARGVDGGTGGFRCVDDPDADVVSAFNSQHMDTMGSASRRSVLGLSRRRATETQMEGGEEEALPDADPAGQEAEAAEPVPAEEVQEDGDAPE